VDKKKIEPIPALDHSTIEYDAFTKDFYEEKPSISGEAFGAFQSCLNCESEILFSLAHVM